MPRVQRDDRSWGLAGAIGPKDYFRLWGRTKVQYPDAFHSPSICGRTKTDWRTIFPFEEKSLRSLSLGYGQP